MSIDREAFDPRLEVLLACAHVGWQPVLRRGLQAVAVADPGYLPALLDGEFLPTQNRLFAAFAESPAAVRHVLMGEGPYPRAASATGVCFMDGAVDELWSEQGLSKPVNRATSLRNFMKMLLVADERLQPTHTAGAALQAVATAARAPDSPFIQTLPELQANLISQGFLLLNAALVFRPAVPPVREARAWRPLLQCVLDELARRGREIGGRLPNLVLWGKIAGQIQALNGAADFPQIVAEHPYNLSFISNPDMLTFFRPMSLLQRR